MYDHPSEQTTDSNWRLNNCHTNRKELMSIFSSRRCSNSFSNSSTGLAFRMTWVNNASKSNRFVSVLVWKKFQNVPNFFAGCFARAVRMLNESTAAGACSKKTLRGVMLMFRNSYTTATQNARCKSTSGLDTYFFVVSGFICFFMGCAVGMCRSCLYTRFVTPNLSGANDVANGLFRTEKVRHLSLNY